MNIILIFFFLFQTGDYYNLKDVNRIEIGPTFYVKYSSDGIIEARGGQIWLNNNYWFSVKNVAYLSSFLPISSDTLLYSANKDGVGLYCDTLCLWNTLIQNGYSVVRRVDFNGNNIIAAFCGEDGVFFLDYYSGDIIDNVDGENSINGVFLNDSNLVIIDSLSTVEIFNIFSGKERYYDIKATDIFRKDSLLLFAKESDGFEEYVIDGDSILANKSFTGIYTDHVLLTQNNGYIIGSTINYKPYIYLIDSLFNVKDSLIYNNGAVTNMDIKNDTLVVSLKNGGSLKILVSDSLQLLQDYPGVNEIMDMGLDSSGRLWFTGGYGGTILNCDINMSNWKIVSTSTPVVAIDIDSSYLYVAKSWGGIGIYEINGDTIDNISSFSYSGRKCMDIKKNDNYCFIADAAKGLVILDVSDKYNPSVVAMDSIIPLNKIELINDSIIAGIYGGYIIRYNISDISNPFMIDSIYTGCVDFHFADDTVYLALGYEGVGYCALQDSLIFNKLDIDLSDYIKSVHKSPWNELYLGTSTGMKVCLLSDTLPYIIGEYPINDYVWYFLFDSLWCIWGTKNSGLFRACTDVNPPFIVKTLPYSDEVVDSLYLSFNLYLNDFQSGVDSVNVFADGSKINGFLYDTVWQSGLYYFTEDTHRIDIDIKDNAFNSSNFTYYFICDTSSPYIESIYPTDGTVLSDTLINMKILARDISLNNGYVVNGNDTTYLMGDGDTLSGNVKLSEGENDLFIRILDKAQHYKDTLISVFVDLYSPVISVNPQSDKIINQSNFSMYINIDNAKYFDSGIDSLICMIDSNYYIPDDTINNASFVIHINDLLEGWHSREIICKDKAGYKTILKDSFGIDITPPYDISFSVPRDTVFSASYKLIWLKGQDNMSGVNRYMIMDSLHNFLYEGIDTVCTINNVYGKLYLYAYDNAGNGIVEDSITICKENNVIVFPSPVNLKSNEYVTFEGVEEGDILVIMNREGNILKMLEVSDNTFGKIVISSDIFDNKQGIYLWYVKKGDGTLIRGKLGVVK